MKKASVIVAGLAAACLWAGIGGTASAQEAQPQDQRQAAQDSYSFVAQPGNSMSVMARKAVQLYDQKNDSVTLPEPCIIMAETNIVQKSNPRWLEVGENVTFNEATIAEYARQANGLTEEQRAAWSVYSNNADFALADVKLASEVAATQPDANAPGDSNQQSNSGEASAEGEATTENPTEQQQSDASGDTTNGNAPWYWWVVGAGTIGALYYLLGGRTKPQE